MDDEVCRELVCLGHRSQPPNYLQETRWLVGGLGFLGGFRVLSEFVLNKEPRSMSRQLQPVSGEFVRE